MQAESWRHLLSEKSRRLSLVPLGYLHTSAEQTGLQSMSCIPSVSHHLIYSSDLTTARMLLGTMYLSLWQRIYRQS